MAVHTDVGIGAATAPSRLRATSAPGPSMPLDAAWRGVGVRNVRDYMVGLG